MGEPRESHPDDESGAEGHQLASVYNRVSQDPSYRSRPRAVSENYRGPISQEKPTLNKQRTKDQSPPHAEQNNEDSEDQRPQKIFDLPDSQEKFQFDSTKRPLSREYIKRDTVGSRGSGQDDKNVTRTIFMNTFTKIMEGIQEEQKSGDRDRAPGFAETQIEFGRANSKGLPADGFGIQGKSFKTSNMPPPQRSIRSRANTSIDKKPKNPPSMPEDPDRLNEYRKTIRDKLSSK